MDELSPDEIDDTSTDWFYAEINDGTLTCMRWDGWILTVPLGAPPREFSILQAFCALPVYEVPLALLGPLQGFASFDRARAGCLGSTSPVPWFAGELQEDGVKLLRPNSWSIVVPWDTTWPEVVRKLVAWSYLTGQLITPAQVGPTMMYIWQESGRYIPIGKYPFIQFSLSPFWCNSMN